MIAGALRPTSGSIIVDGVDITQAPDPKPRIHGAEERACPRHTGLAAKPPFSAMEDLGAHLPDLEWTQKMKGGEVDRLSIDALASSPSHAAREHPRGAWHLFERVAGHEFTT